jgi:hypothetical protein
MSRFQLLGEFGSSDRNFGAEGALSAIVVEVRDLKGIDFRLSHLGLICQGIAVLVGSHGQHGTKRRLIPYYGE